jgi:prepilin-type N-terminal cleavage/methylation domain-containing protein
MKLDRRGFSIVEALIVIVVVGLIAAAGWLMWSRNKTNKSTSNSVDTTQSQPTSSSNDPAKDIEHSELNGIKYAQPSGWKSAEKPTKPFGTEGSYLLSPDYTEAGLGQLSITKGAYIHFQTSQIQGLGATTSVEQAKNLIMNDQNGYHDTSTVAVSTVSGKQVVMFESGHTTHGVTVLYKTATDTWLETSYSTVLGGGGENNSKTSTHYAVFESWLNEFVSLN